MDISALMLNLIWKKLNLMLVTKIYEKQLHKTKETVYNQKHGKQKRW